MSNGLRVKVNHVPPRLVSILLMLKSLISRVSTEVLFWSATVTVMLADDAAMLALVFS